MSEERRQFIRVNSRLTAIVTVVATGKARRALTKDISGGGMCFITDEVLEPGTALAVELKLPDQDTPIAFQGAVAWSRPVGGPGKSYQNPTAETGVTFMAINPKDRVLLRQYATLNARRL